LASEFQTAEIRVLRAVGGDGICIEAFGCVGRDATHKVLAHFPCLFATLSAFTVVRVVRRAGDVRTYVLVWICIGFGFEPTSVMLQSLKNNSQGGWWHSSIQCASSKASWLASDIVLKAFKTPTVHSNWHN
jgi:hypothetical protein